VADQSGSKDKKQREAIEIITSPSTLLKSRINIVALEGVPNFV
jgi:hypothetical protein